MEAGELKAWTQKDVVAKSFLLRTIKSELVVKIAVAKTAAKAWNALKTEFGQTGSGSIQYWFTRLTDRCLPDEDIIAHVTGF
jgi:hypothetical protein